MMGGQFENTMGEALLLSQINFGINMENIPAYDKGGDYKKSAPQVQIAAADTEGSTPYYFISDAKKVNNVYVPGWVGATGKAADPTIAPGIGYWYRDPSSDTPNFTFAGQVLPDSPWEKTFAAVDYYMLVNPFPVSYTLTDTEQVIFEDIAVDAPSYDKGGDYKKSATQIQVPSATTEGFTTYYYIADAKKVNNVYVPGWVTTTGKDAGTITVPAGRGCWFKPAKTGRKVTFLMK